MSGQQGQSPQQARGPASGAGGQTPARLGSLSSPVALSPGDRLGALRPASGLSVRSPGLHIPDMSATLDGCRMTEVLSALVRDLRRRRRCGERESPAPGLAWVRHGRLWGWTRQPPAELTLTRRRLAARTSYPECPPTGHATERRQHSPGLPPPRPAWRRSLRHSWSALSKTPHVWTPAAPEGDLYTQTPHQRRSDERTVKTLEQPAVWVGPLQCRQHLQLTGVLRLPHPARRMA